MPVRLDKWVARHVADAPENASVLLLSDRDGSLAALLGQPRRNTVCSSGLWLEYEDETDDFAIDNTMADIAMNTVPFLRHHGESWAALLLQAWREHWDQPDADGTDVFVVACLPWRPDADPMTPKAIDFSLRHLVDIDSGERTTLSTLVREFLGKPQKSRDYFEAEKLGAVASRAGKAIFAEDDPLVAEQTFASLFDLDFHLHQDPDGAAYWSLVRDGVTVNAVAFRENGTHDLLASLVPTDPYRVFGSGTTDEPEPRLIGTSFLVLDDRYTAPDEPAIVRLAKRIASLQDEAESMSEDA